MGQYQGFVQIRELCIIGLDGAVSGVCSRSGNGTSYG